MGRMLIVIFAIFRQNHLFSVGDKNTFFQKHRFHNPELSSSLVDGGAATHLGGFQRGVFAGGGGISIIGVGARTGCNT